MEKHRTAKQATDNSTIGRMRIACWLSKATNTHSEYVIVIAFPQQKWLRESASVLRYTYTACLVSDFIALFPGLELAVGM